MLILLPSIEAVGQTLEVLHSFQNTDGARPTAGLIQASDGYFYGTTQGVSSNGGTVFRVSADGAFTTLAAFNGTNGAYPYAGVIEAPDGNFYGTTEYGGSNADGTIFRVTPGGQLTTLFEFVPDGVQPAPNGRFPECQLVLGRDGCLYGTTEAGGTNSDWFGSGTIFKITTNGDFTSIFSFGTTNGQEPRSGLVLGADGDFYGTTYWGGDYGDGTVFKVTPQGDLTMLYSFNGSNSDGYWPMAPLVQGGDGNFYGTTDEGDDYYSGWGTIFRITPAGHLTTLVTFQGQNGAFPDWAGLMQASDGYLYGTTTGTTLVYRMNYEGQFTTIAQPTDNTNGLNPVSPEAGVIEGRDGNLYGTTYRGGAYFASYPDGYGTVFRVVMPAILNSAVFGNQMVLSWPTNKVGFILQSTMDLNSTNWLDCTNPPAIVGRQLVVTNPIASGSQFFRLKK